jgi:uncharacterized protein YukE
MLTTGVDSAGLQSAGDALRAQAETMREALRLLEVANTSLAAEWSAAGSDEFEQVFARYRSVVAAGIQAVELLAAGVATAGSTYADAEAAVQGSAVALQKGQ